MTPPPNNENGESIPTRARLNPATWTRRTRLIAGGAALALVLAGTGTGFAYHQYAIDRDCQVQTELFGSQKTELTKAVKDAKAALALVEGDKAAAHTTGFTEWNRDIVPTTESIDQSADTAQSDAPQSAEAAQSSASASASIDGKTLTADLKKAIDSAKKRTKDAAPKQCSTGDDLNAIEALTSSRQADLDALTAQTKAFTAAVDDYRLKTAATKAASSMDTAKADLAAAQKAATDQLAVVDADTALSSETEIKSRYDALKKTENDSHSVSTTVTVSTYDEAVASIEKAKAVAAKTGEVNTATQALKDAIKAYQDAKAAEEAAAQAAAQAQAAQAARAQQGYTAPNRSTYSGGGSSYSNSGGGGGSYTAPAPASSAPAPSSGNSSSGGQKDTRVDFGAHTSGELDTTPGKCWYIEGKAYCNPK